ncbi:uncharacterized protein LOC143289296 [Babylonia areolata]|uniref:uncharacterized protein LOC143289296 n=1 Tax=Babylonia areolata TaxID=304850 RepID=UPI003FD25DF1
MDWKLCPKFLIFWWIQILMPLLGSISMVLQTNLYAAQYKAASGQAIKPHNLLADWHDVNTQEIKIASQFKCGETKSRYLITFSLAPYFSEMMLEKGKSSDEYVLLFDESLNNKTQMMQLDFHIRYWHGNIVKTRFLTMEFMGHATAVDLQEKSETVFSDLNLKTSSLVQISIDSPAVNLKLLEHINSDMVENHGVGLLRVGSCGLHVVHNAFRSGCEASKWDIESFLASAYTLFKDRPARREDFVTVTGSTILPAKFCTHRWLENKSVATRAIEMIGDLKKFVKAAVDKHVTLPRNKSFDIVKTGTGVLSTPLLACRLAFFCSVASILEPFLQWPVYWNLF